MEILWWLVPSLVVCAVAMGWVGWLGREGRGEVDREVAVRRLAKALTKDVPAPRMPDPRPAERSTGIAVRPARGTDGAPSQTRRVS